MALSEYVNRDIEGKISFSGSNFSNFTSDPYTFWNNVFGLSENEQSTSTVLGTIVHHCASEYILKGQVDTNEVEAYIDSYQNTDIDCNAIRESYKAMANEVFKKIDTFKVFGQLESEVFMHTDISKHGAIKGTLDCIIGKHTIVDFKTTSQLSRIQVLPFKYIRQLQAYYYIAKQNGYPITQAKIMYITVPRMNAISESTGKPLRDYPCQIYEIPVNVEYLDTTKIKPLIDLIGESIDFIVEHPEWKHLITRRKEQDNGNQDID